jgi:protein involved in polysaccharide export with SLBB domain
MWKDKSLARSCVHAHFASVLFALMVEAVCLHSARPALAQGFPAQSNPVDQAGFGGITGQPSGAGCDDPLMATSPLCSQQVNGVSQGIGRPQMNQGAGGYLPGQPTQVTTFSDVAPLGAASRSPTQTPIPPERLTEFQRFAASTTEQILPIFGANLFSNVPTTFAPLDQAPIPPGYIIGPDDEIRLRVWGQINFSANLRVNREGDIFIPQVGSIHLAGLRFSDLSQHLRAAIARVYRNFDLTSDLGQIRAIQIYVTGQARRPGVYTVSSLSTMIDTLFASGGPSVEGSMRRIELRRSGQTVTTLDLYGFLIHGDNSADTRLLSGDVIFIPAVGPMAAILGSIRKPAIYELVPGEAVSELVANAGGLTAIASDSRISLERIVEHQARQAMELSLDNAGKSMPLRDGDIVRVFSIVPQYSQTVMLRGNVANPGRFAWHEGMRLSDLIPDQQSLITRDYWWRRTQLGLPSLEYEPLAELANVRQPVSQVDLQNRPPTSMSLQIPPQNPKAARTDAASQPSMAPAAAGLDAADSNQLTQQTSMTQRKTEDTANDSSSSEAAANSQMMPSQSPPVQVRLSSPEIYWNYAVIERMDLSTLKTSLIPFDLGKLVKDHDPTQNLELKPADVVTVFSQNDIHVPIREQASFVRLEGEFLHAGIYSVLPGETLRTLIARAGGMTANAYLYGSQFTRRSTQILQQRRLDESIQDLTLQMERGNLALASSPLSTPQDLAGVAAAEASERELIAQLKLIRATGRIVFEFRPDTAGSESVPNITLEDGDSFTVPSRPSTVSVVGSVFNQNSFLYRSAARTEFYLRMAGGPNAYADRKRIFIVRANGAVVSRASVRGGWGDEFDRLQMNPGDTLVVPDKSIKPSAWRNVLDLSQFASQFAFAAAAIDVLR